MGAASDLLASLESLGLSGYEGRALAHLLLQGPRAGPDIARDADIPFGRVYDTLHALQDRGLVAPGSGRPRIYTAIPASAVPGRLLASRRRDLQHQEQKASQETARLEAALRGLPSRGSPSPQMYGVRIGEDASREFLVEATHAATASICAYLSLERVSQADLALFEAFRLAIERGVPTRLLLRRADVDYLLSTPYVGQVLDALRPHLGDALQVRLASGDSPAFSVLDGERVVLGLRNPLAPDSYFAVVHLEDRAFASDLQGKFDAMWRKGQWDAGLAKVMMTKPALRRLASRVRRGAA